MTAGWHTLTAVRELVARLPWTHPRRLGLMMAETGAVVLVATLPFKLAFKYAGLGLAVAGCLLALLPLHRLPGFWWAAWFAVLQLATELAQPWSFEAGGMTYSWLTIYVVAAGLLAPEPRRWALRLLVATLAVTVGLALAQFCVGFTIDVHFWQLAVYGERGGRVGAWHGPVAFGNLMLGIALLLAAGATDRDLGRRTRWEGAGLAILGVLLSGVRMAIIGLAAGLEAVALVRLRGRWRTALILGTPLVLVAVAGVLLLRDPERFYRLLRLDDGRFAIWRTGWAVIADHPWWGVGSGDGFRFAFLRRIDPERLSEFGWGFFNLHNSYLTIWAQHGLITLAAYLGWLVAVLHGVFRQTVPGGRARALCLAAVAATVVVGGVDDLAGRPIYHLPLMAAIGLAMVLGLGEPRPQLAILRTDRCT